MYGKGLTGPIVGLVVLLLAVALVRFAGANAEVAAALPTLIVLTLVTFPLITRVAARQDDPVIRRLLLLAFPLKLAAAFARYYVAFDVYGGASDAARYHQVGSEIARSFQEGVFVLGPGQRLLSTGAVDLFTGAFYTLAGPTIIGAYVFFAWLAMWGQYGFLRGFQIALPTANHRRYALLVLLLPSMLYWPSGLGKESLVIAGLGLGVYGMARVFDGQIRGLGMALLGTAAAAIFRPHIALMLAAAAVIGYALKGVRARQAGGRPLNPIIYLLGAAVLVVSVNPLIDTAQRYLGLDDPQQSTLDQVQDVLEFRGGQTEQGGSEFTPVQVDSPLDVPAAALTVLFRPFPFEADNVQALAAGIESLLLLLGAVMWLQPLRLPARLSRAPMLMMALVFLLAFVVAFSIIGNFGILARQRVQALPFLLMLLSMSSSPGSRAVVERPLAVRSLRSRRSQPPRVSG